MNISVHTTIRDRGQITLPQAIRRHTLWLTPKTPVEVIANPDQVTIRPYTPKATDWNAIWESLHLAQSLSGKQGDLSSFITKDRLNH